MWLLLFKCSNGLQLQTLYSKNNSIYKTYNQPFRHLISLMFDKIYETNSHELLKLSLPKLPNQGLVFRILFQAHSNRMFIQRSNLIPTDMPSLRYKMSIANTNRPLSCINISWWTFLPVRPFLILKQKRLRQLKYLYRFVEQSNVPFRAHTCCTSIYNYITAVLV